MTWKTNTVSPCHIYHIISIYLSYISMQTSYKMFASHIPIPLQDLRFTGLKEKIRFKLCLKVIDMVDKAQHRYWRQRETAKYKNIPAPLKLNVFLCAQWCCIWHSFWKSPTFCLPRIQHGISPKTDTFFDMSVLMHRRSYTLNSEFRGARLITSQLQVRT